MSHTDDYADKRNAYIEKYNKQQHERYGCPYENVKTICNRLSMHLLRNNANAHVNAGTPDARLLPATREYEGRETASAQVDYKQENMMKGG